LSYVSFGSYLQSHFSAGRKIIQEWAKNITVRLTNGKASFMIVGERLEMVIISAGWIDGRSSLRSLTTMREIGVD